MINKQFLFHTHQNVYLV